MMTWLMLVALAAALAADAFAVALCQGAVARPGVRDAVRIGTAFGLAQAVMPLIGWAAGVAFASVIRDVDHWVAFGLLAVLGGRTLRDGLRDEPGDCTILSGWALLGAAVATSIDAAAAGVTLPSLGANVAVACAVIGGVTLGLCAAGVFLGAAGGQRLGKRAEIVGGILLLLIGTKVLIQHVYFGG
jgi:manganese efflux pump family protein